MPPAQFSKKVQRRNQSFIAQVLFLPLRASGLAAAIGQDGADRLRPAQMHMETAHKHTSSQVLARHFVNLTHEMSIRTPKFPHRFWPDTCQWDTGALHFPAPSRRGVAHAWLAWPVAPMAPQEMDELAGPGRASLLFLRRLCSIAAWV